MSKLFKPFGHRIFLGLFLLSLIFILTSILLVVKVTSIRKEVEKKVNTIGTASKIESSSATILVTISDSTYEENNLRLLNLVYNKEQLKNDTSFNDLYVELDLLDAVLEKQLLPFSTIECRNILENIKTISNKIVLKNRKQLGLLSSVLGRFWNYMFMLIAAASVISVLLSITGYFNKIKSDKIQELTLQNNDLFNSSIDNIITTNLDGRILSMNRTAQLNYGFNVDESTLIYWDSLFKHNNEFEHVKKIMREEGEFSGEITSKTKEGKTFSALLSMSTLKDVDQKPIGMMGITRNIAQQKKFENQLKESLKEKETLLKEVHHRVKNNLQVISSILNLQSNYIKDDRIASILKEGQDRIKSMSYVHEILYKSKKFSSLNLGEYLNGLMDHLTESFVEKHKSIAIVKDIEPITVTLDQAIPCGLIVNEIITNASKYAFPDKNEGKIKISLKNENNRIILRINDNGIGLPQHFNPEHSETLGMQLIIALTEQLDGNMDFTSKDGLHFYLSFEVKKTEV